MNPIRRTAWLTIVFSLCTSPCWGQTAEPMSELDILQTELQRLQEELDDMNAKRMAEMEKKIALAEQVNKLRKEVDELQLKLADRNLKIKEEQWVREDLSRKLAAALTQVITEGHWQLREGRYNAARRLFNAALELDPTRSDAHMGLASCSYSLGDIEGAKAILGNILAKDPMHAQALGLRGLIAFREGQLKYASELLEKALVTAPGEPQLHNYMGMVLLARHRRTQALRSFERAVELDPASAEIHMNIARLLATTRPKNLRKAKTHYDTALSLGRPPNKELEREIYKDRTLPLTGAVHSLRDD